MGESVSGEQTGAARWLSVHDDLLRGLTHTLSNRVGTITATAYLLDVQPGSLATAATALRDEGERLDTLLQLLRLLPRRTDVGAEPIVPTDATTQAINLQAYHPTLGEVPVSVVLDGDLQPAYADPSALVMALTVVLTAAQRSAHSDGRAVLTISSDTDAVSFDASGRRGNGLLGTADAETAQDVHAACWLLASCGGVAVASESGARIVVPTLQYARRASRR